MRWAQEKPAPETLYGEVAIQILNAALVSAVQYGRDKDRAVLRVQPVLGVLPLGPASKLPRSP